MNKKQTYQHPEIKCFWVTPERGFAASGDTDENGIMNVSWEEGGSY